MSAYWQSSIAADVAGTDAGATKRMLAQSIVLATVLFNFVLCFVNTTVFEVTANLVIASEAGLIGLSLLLTWDRSRAQYSIVLLLGAYLATVMVLRADLDLQFARDVLIPIVFFFLGKSFGTARGGDRLIMFVALATLAVGLFEWFALDTYLHYFDVLHYYVARGSVTGADVDGPGLYISGTRADARTLLPFLGDHRASGLFLEPVSLGNFGAIAFAWILLRDRSRPVAFIIKLLVIATLLVLGDARFGFYLCFATIAVYIAAPYLRPWMLFVAPFLALFGLFLYAGFTTQNDIGNDLPGRLWFAGNLLRSLDVAQFFGLQTNDTSMEDAGYVYMLVSMGALGMAALWGLFCFSPAPDRDAWRYKAFVAVYIVGLLTIGTSLFTIKTAALAWFLYGTLHNPNRMDELADGG